MRKLCHIFEEKAAEYSIKFNANRSKCIVFNSDRRSFSCGSACPRFFVDNQRIDFIDSWPPRAAEPYVPVVPRLVFGPVMPKGELALLVLGV
jgi:hypothetical protein